MPILKTIPDKKCIKENCPIAILQIIDAIAHMQKYIKYLNGVCLYNFINLFSNVL